MSATSPSTASIDRVADLLEEAAREIRSLAGTSGIPLPSLGGVEAECDSNGQEPEEHQIMTPPTTIEAPTNAVDSPPLLMTRREVADLLRIHERTLGRIRADPEVRFPEPVQLGSALRWRRATIMRWLAARAS